MKKIKLVLLAFLMVIAFSFFTLTIIYAISTKEHNGIAALLLVISGIVSYLSATRFVRLKQVVNLEKLQKIK